MLKRIALAMAFAPMIAMAAPRLVSSWPQDGATEVPAGDQVLVFEFSEPMARDRMSVTSGDAGAIPEFIGPPSFSEDGRTFRIRMKLQPGLRYAVGANGPKHRNFVSAGGEAAESKIIRFSTAP